MRAARAGWLRPPYKGPFTELGRELRQAREAQPNAAAPQIERPAYGVAAQWASNTSYNVLFPRTAAHAGSVKKLAMRVLLAATTW